MKKTSRRSAARSLVIRSVKIPSIIILLANAAYAVDSRPLTEVVKTAVASCSPQSQVSVPIITWGGDIATIYANGNAAETKKGSIFDEGGLKIKLNREDVFTNQLQAYLSCKSPYLRGTMGMINMAAQLADRDARTKLHVVYQMTWSAGGDALVVKDGIAAPGALKGKTIAVQAYGPHLDYLAKVLEGAGLSIKDVKIRWTKDLTGTDETPVAAFRATGVDAAMVIIPDALALTSNGTVGTGSEDSVRGAKILLSTKSANRIIADVYAVRADYLQANREQVQKFVHGLMIAEESLSTLFKNRGKEATAFKAMIENSANLLLDSPQATADTEAMYADAQFVGWNGNVTFFTDKNHPRNLSRLVAEGQDAFLALGLLSARASIQHPNWNYPEFKDKLSNTTAAEAQRFDPEQVARVVGRKQQQGTLDGDGLFSFEVYFKPNQNDFDPSMYQTAFDKAIDLASTYGGAIITVEGHSDPLGYLKKRKERAEPVVLKRIEQAAKNLSLTRATAVRESLIGYAKSKGITLDESQIAVVGHGIARPKSGICDGDPCAPKTEQDWLNNMRVEFRIIQVEAEESVFRPL